MTTDDIEPSPSHRLATALASLRQGDVEGAEAAARSLADRDDARLDLLFLQCEIALHRGDLKAALDAITLLAASDQDNVGYLLKLADVLTIRHERSEAKRIAHRVAELSGRDAKHLWASGRILARCGDPAAAATLYDRAALQLEEPALLYDQGSAHFFSGASEESEAAFDRLLAIAPQIGHGAYLRSVVRKQTPTSNHVTSLVEGVRRSPPQSRAHAGYCYALAKELEDLERDDEAWDQLVQGAASMRSTLRYDAAIERENVDAVRNAFTGDALDRIPPGWYESGAIFVVGMPRTGTTLLERLMARHGNVVSAGELPDFGDALREATQARLSDRGDADVMAAALELDFGQLGRAYMSTARQATDGAAVFLDKMPINYMYCGLIQKALPKAKIIHVVRDPMDTCYAIFKTLFANAYYFSYDIDELAAYFATYSRMMQHWHCTMPGLILDVRYEELVTSPDPTVRRILEWCGVRWNSLPNEDARLARASMTASASQVREPIHARSIGAWKKHQRGLAPLRRALIASGIDI